MHFSLFRLFNLAKEGFNGLAKIFLKQVRCGYFESTARKYFRMSHKKMEEAESGVAMALEAYLVW